MPDTGVVTDIMQVSGDNRKGGVYVGLLSKPVFQLPEPWP